jgi:hypothetical protein
MINEIPQSSQKVSSIRTTFSVSYRWGWAPVISLVCAFGLFLIAFANALSRVGSGRAELFFWSGLVTLILPCALRLTSISASRRERIALLMMLGLMLYWVKILHSPYGFNFSDEYVHQYNVTQILQTGSLYSANPIIGVTPFYPGLEIVTSALSALSGLNVYVSGLIIIGLARIILMLALYLFYEQVGGSERCAGIAAMIYASNSNFLFWSAQFSYESLTLPLILLVLFLIAKREQSTDSSEYAGFTVIALLGIVAVVVSHHLSAYFLTLFMAVWALLVIVGPIVVRQFGKERKLAFSHKDFALSRNGLTDKSAAWNAIFPRMQGPNWLVIVAFLLLYGWLFYAASNTLDYLVPVLRAAFLSILNILKGTEAPRTLFESKTGYIAPLWQRGAGLLSVVLLAAGVPLGLKRFWQHYQRNWVVLILAAMGVIYFGMLGLRFSPQAWETGNRTSEYLFIGLAFLLSIGGIEVWRPKLFPLLGKAIFTLSICAIFVGGVIAGWPPRLITQQPSIIRVGTTAIEPQGTAVARWFLAKLGAGNRIGADPVNGRLLLAYGNQFAYEGKYPDVRDIIDLPEFPGWQVEVLQNFSIRYIVLDHRLVSRDSMAGYFFDATKGDLSLNHTLIDQAVYDKFNNVASVNRILDSGTITIYDFIKLLGTKQ